MRKHVGWLWIAGFFGLLAAANAQTPSSPAAVTQFDGTYGFVSATRVDETYAVPGSNRIGQCGDTARANRLRPPLTGAGGRQFEGTVSSQGELAVRSATSSSRGGWAGVGDERMFFGRIDGNGTVRARRIDYYCGHDFIWQKEPK